MNHRSRYVLALTLVATTLCADRLFASDSTTAALNRQPTERLVARLTRSFSQVVATNPLVVQRQMAPPAPAPVMFIFTDRSLSIALTSLQFPLPPPQL